VTTGDKLLLGPPACSRYYLRVPERSFVPVLFLLLLFLATDPSSPFPDGVFEAYFGPGQEQGDAGLPAMVASQQQLLLNRMKGIEGGSLQNISQTVGQQLGNWLRGKRCLLVLDDVRSDQIISAFNYDGFQGALLVTGLSADVAWLSAPLQVAITPKRVKDPLDGDSGPSLAMRVLASRASNDKSVVGVPEACQVCAVWPGARQGGHLLPQPFVGVLRDCSGCHCHRCINHVMLYYCNAA